MFHDTTIKPIRLQTHHSLTCEGVIKFPNIGSNQTSCKCMVILSALPPNKKNRALLLSIYIMTTCKSGGPIFFHCCEVDCWEVFSLSIAGSLAPLTKKFLGKFRWEGKQIPPEKKKPPRLRRFWSLGPGEGVFVVVAMYALWKPPGGFAGFV